MAETQDFREEDIVCPKCGKQGKFPVWEKVDVQAQPALKAALHYGALFRYQCPKCGTLVNINYSVLYEDADKKLALYYAANQEDVQQMQQVFNSAPKDYDGPTPWGDYKKRIVVSQNQLREKVLIFDAGLDDRVIELLKLVILANLQEEHPDLEVDEVLCYLDAMGEGTLIFQSGGREVVKAPFTREMYLSLAQDFAPCLAEDSLEVVIDSDWAVKQMQNLQG